LQNFDKTETNRFIPVDSFLAYSRANDHTSMRAHAGVGG